MQQIKLSGLHCPACQKLIERRLKKIQDVQEVMVQLNGLTDINANRVIANEEVMNALNGTEYKIV